MHTHIFLIIPTPLPCCYLAYFAISNKQKTKSCRDFKCQRQLRKIKTFVCVGIPVKEQNPVEEKNILKKITDKFWYM